MKPACIAAVSAAAGRELRKSEIDEIDATIRKQREQMARQDRAAYLAMSPDAQVAEAARRAGQELLAEAAQKRREVIGKINAHARIVAAGGETYDGMRRFIESDADNKSSVQSLESIVEAETKFAVGSLIDAWTAVKGNFFGVFTNARETMDLLKELHGEDSGNARAKKGAEAWKTVTEAMRQKANAVGIRIPKLEDWNIPRSWDQAKVFALGRDKFVDLLFDRANRAKYVHDNGALYDDAELRDFLGHAWESIATDGANKQRPVAVQSGSGNSIKFTLSGVRGPRGQRTANAAKGSLSRQIHLKDAAAYAEIHRAVGERDMFDVMLGHVQMTAAETVAVQQFGANPPQMLEFFLATARKRAKLEGRSEDYTTGQEYRIRNSFDYITGATTGPINERVARLGSNFRQWQVASKLGSAAITSIGDEATMIVTARMNNLSPFKVWGQSLRYLVGAKDIRMAQRAGLGVDSIIGALNRFGYENTIRSLPSKLANAVMTLSLLNRLTDARKAGFGSVMYSAIGKRNREVARLADLDPVDNQVLLSKGITEQDWAIWKLAQREDWGAGTRDVLTPGSVMRTDLAQVERAIDADAVPGVYGLQEKMSEIFKKDKEKEDALFARQGFISKQDIADIQDKSLPRRNAIERAINKLVSEYAVAARNQAMQKLIGATLEEVDTAVLTPRASERARVRGALGNLQPGTYGGEIAQTVMIFKSYPMAFLMRNVRRMMGQEGTTSKLRYAGAMIVTTTLAGMLALQVNQILQGKDPKNMFKGKNVAKNWLAALLKGGALGIYGDFLLSPTSRYGQSPLIALLGPGFGTVSDISDLTIGNIQRGASGKDVRIGAGAVSLLKGNTPGASLWYAKAALDHWIFQQMQEALSPGHLRKTKARAQREFGDSYWWEPGTATPQRPPNLETAVGQ